MTARKQTDRQKLIQFVKWMNKELKWMNKERICGCVQLIPASVVTCFYWDKLEKYLRKINKNDLNEGSNF